MCQSCINRVCVCACVEMIGILEYILASFLMFEVRLEIKNNKMDDGQTIANNILGQFFNALYHASIGSAQKYDK